MAARCQGALWPPAARAPKALARVVRHHASRTTLSALHPTVWPAAWVVRTTNCGLREFGKATRKRMEGSLPPTAYRLPLTAYRVTQIAYSMLHVGRSAPTALRGLRRGGGGGAAPPPPPRNGAGRTQSSDSPPRKRASPRHRPPSTSCPVRPGCDAPRVWADKCGTARTAPSCGGSPRNRALWPRPPAAFRSARRRIRRLPHTRCR